MGGKSRKMGRVSKKLIMELKSLKKGNKTFSVKNKKGENKKGESGKGGFFNL